MYLLLFLTLIGVIYYLSFKRPEAMIALTICMFGIETYCAAKDSFFVRNPSFVNIVILIALCARVAVDVMKGKKISPFNNVTWQISMLLLGFAALSGLWTPAFDQYLTNCKRGAPYILIYLFLVPVLMRSPRAARNTLLWTLGMGSVLAMLLYFTCDWGTRGVFVAGQGKYVRPGETAKILAIAQLGGSIAVIAALIRTRRSRLLVVARWALVALGLILAIRSGSRGQTMFSMGCIALFVPLSNRSVSLKGILISMFSLAIFGAVAYYLFVNFATHGRWGSTMRSLEGRQVMWEAMLTKWIEEGPVTWILGLGGASSYKYVGFYIHNVPIEILCEYGLVGASLYIRMCWETYKHVAIGIRLAPSINKERFNILVVYTSLFAFEVLCTLKSGSLYGQQLFILYGIAIETTMRNWKSDAVRAKKTAPSKIARKPRDRDRQ